MQKSRFVLGFWYGSLNVWTLSTPDGKWSIIDTFWYLILEIIYSVCMWMWIEQNHMIKTYNTISPLSPSRDRSLHHSHVTLFPCVSRLTRAFHCLCVVCHDWFHCLTLTNLIINPQHTSIRQLLVLVKSWPSHTAYNTRVDDVLPLYNMNSTRSNLVISRFYDIRVFICRYSITNFDYRLIGKNICFM